MLHCCGAFPAKEEGRFGNDGWSILKNLISFPGVPTTYIVAINYPGIQ